MLQRFNVHIPKSINYWPTWFYRVVRNTLLDLRFGTILSGEQDSRYAHLGASPTANSDYEALDYIFKDRIKPTDVLVDVGCGKGRVINWWLSQGHKSEIYGLELDPDVAENARQRLAKWDNVTIVTGNAVENIPANANVFYLYHPFNRPVMVAFKERLMELFDKDDDITLLYHMIHHVDVFADDPAWTVQISEVGKPSPYPFEGMAVIKMAK
ncbi:MAG: class I SAM-dependent methyltransferase [Chloroflexota bacterium]